MKYQLIAAGPQIDLGVRLSSIVASGVTAFTDVYGHNHLIIFPSLFNKDPLVPGLHYMIKGSEIIFVKRLPEAFGNARDIHLIENEWGLVESFILADHGLEYNDKPWPLGDIYNFVVTPSGELVGSKISEFLAFNHNLAVHDFTEDGRPDIIVQNMRQIGNPAHAEREGLNAYASAGDEFDLVDLKFDRSGGVSWGGGAVAFIDLEGDGRKELIQAAYATLSDPDWEWGVLRVFEIDRAANLKFKFSVEREGAALSMGVSDLIPSDIDLDGDLDVIAIFEGRHPQESSKWSGVAYQFFKNVNNELIFSGEIVLNSKDFPQREARSVDVNFDARPDLVRQTQGDGQFKNLFYLNTDQGFMPMTPAVDLPADASHHLFTRLADVSFDSPTLISVYQNGTSVYPVLWSIESESSVHLDVLAPFTHAFGTIGNDEYRLGPKATQSRIYGGLGVDSVSVEFPLEGLQVNIHESIRALVRVTGPMEYRLLLNDVERLLSETLGVAFDVSGAGGQAYRIYKAAFNRTPDVGGLGYWIGQMDKGMDLIEVSARFIDSKEFRDLYGASPTKAEFLTKVYTNVLGRAPDQGGYDWWLNAMNTDPSKTFSKVLADFSESAENLSGTAPLVATGIVYEPWSG